VGFFNADQYTGDIEWNPGITGGVFAVSTSYTATVTLTAKASYTFNGVTANSFSYTGATSVTNPANSRVVTVVFPATGSTILPAGIYLFGFPSQRRASMMKNGPPTTASLSYPRAFPS
jgi:signal recognition particle receptor subunit beta